MARQRRDNEATTARQRRGLETIWVPGKIGSAFLHNFYNWNLSLLAISDIEDYSYMTLAGRDETKSNQFSASPAKPISMRAESPSECTKSIRSESAAEKPAGSRRSQSAAAIFMCSKRRENVLRSTSVEIERTPSKRRENVLRTTSVEIERTPSKRRENVLRSTSVEIERTRSDRRASTLNLDQTNYLNMALIFLSFLLALVLPFELFITAYVLLGPLHYLTEIGWLHRRQYFMKGRNDYRWIWILVVAVTFNYLFFKNPLVMPALTLIALFSGLIFMSVKDSTRRIQLISVTAIAVSLIVQADSRTVFFAYYLATLIHVFCFTALFMLLGCLKEKSFSSAVSLSVLILCASSLLSGVHPVGGYQSSPIFLDSALAFGSMERTLATHLGWTPNWEHGVQAMRFIAFAYTYHYLNWFSKTNVIAWHKQDRSVWTTIIVVYIGALGLYAYDFKLGLQALFLLSVGHVYLEFPLNWFSIGAIGKKLTALVPAFSISSAPPVAALQQAPVTD